jgi:hypothetical protein
VTAVVIVLGLNDGRRIGYAIYGAEDGRPLMFFSGTSGPRIVARLGEILDALEAAVGGGAKTGSTW